MWIDNGLARLVDEFWDNAAGDEDKFPRDMFRLASLALPLQLERIDRLDINDVQDWLGAHNLGKPRYRALSLSIERNIPSHRDQTRGAPCPLSRHRTA